MIMYDTAMTMYLLMALIFSYDSALFIWWALHAWRFEARKPTSVYSLLTAILCGISYSAWLHVYARYLRLSCESEPLGVLNSFYYMFMSSDIWQWRYLPLLIAGFMLGVMMTVRVIKSYLLRCWESYGEEDF